MFPLSTHKSYWMFNDEQELTALREKANKEYKERYNHKAENLNKEEKAHYFLTAEEERILLRFYEVRLIEFCKTFKPAMPKSVYGTAFHYMKRFYVHNSVMDFHPKEILVTCVFLACKVEEFNVTIRAFVGNVKGDRARATDVILNNELLLMQQLNYQLVVHNIYKPLDGLLLDVKARSNLRNPDRLRPTIEEMIDKLYLTDACLLYSPSQLALATILHSASKNQENLDEYVTKKLLGGDDSQCLLVVIEVIRKIRTFLTIVMDSNDSTVNKDLLRQLEKRLENCRNEENNPNSEIFRQKQQEMFLDEEEREEMIAKVF